MSTAGEHASPPVVVVGYTDVLGGALDNRLPAGSVVWVDEPDVVRKRGLTDRVRTRACTRALVSHEYQLPGSAARLLRAHPELTRARAIVPGAEYGVVCAAELADALGLPGATPAAATVLRDKRLVRRITGRHGVVNPRQATAPTARDVAAAMAAWGTAVVMKPANRQGSVGTELVRSAADVPAAWARCLAQDEGVMVPDRDMGLVMLVEELVEGAEFSVEVLVHGGEVRFASTTSKHLFPGPRPIERGHVVPADVPADLQHALVRATQDVVSAVGFAAGLAHCEWIVRHGVPHLVECAGRMPGDGIGALIDLCWDTDLVRGWLATLQGADPAPAGPRAQQLHRSAAVWFAAWGPGRVATLGDVSTVVDSCTGVVSAGLGVGVAEGAQLPELTSSWGRSAHVVAVGDTGGSALARAQAGCAQLPVTMAG